MLEIIGKTDDLDLNSIEATVDQFYKAQNISKDVIVELKFSDCSEMQKLNKKYLGNDKNTDVLSFPQSNFPSQKSILGTICIAREEIKFGKKHIIELVLHGLFHLIGFDHDLNSKKWHEAVEKYEKLH